METLQQQKTPQKTSYGSRSSVSNAAIAYPSRTIVHAKLEMTQPCDHDEQEADAAANDIVSGGKIRRKISNGGSSGTAVSPQVESQIAHLQGGGHAMPAGLRNMMENGFGRDFSQVRLHTDSQAADMSSSISARAFTHGNDIYFNRGQFSPNTAEGQRLVAHELTHVAQGTGKVGREEETSEKDRKPIQSLTISDSGKNLIKALEGFRKEPYEDSSGYCTIGCGHLIEKKNCKNINPQKLEQITEKNLDELFEQDLQKKEKKVIEKIAVPLYQHEYDALVSLVFNLGSLPPKLCGLLNEQKYERASIEMLDIVKSNGKIVEGLKNRRIIEFYLFNTGEYLLNKKIKDEHNEFVRDKIDYYSTDNSDAIQGEQKDNLNVFYPKKKEENSEFVQRKERVDDNTSMKENTLKKREGIWKFVFNALDVIDDAIKKTYLQSLILKYALKRGADSKISLQNNKIAVSYKKYEEDAKNAKTYTPFPSLVYAKTSTDLDGEYELTDAAIMRGTKCNFFVGDVLFEAYRDFIELFGNIDEKAISNEETISFFKKELNILQNIKYDKYEGAKKMGEKVLKNQKQIKNIKDIIAGDIIWWESGSHIEIVVGKYDEAAQTIKCMGAHEKGAYAIDRKIIRQKNGHFNSKKEPFGSVIFYRMTQLPNLN